MAGELRGTSEGNARSHEQTAIQKIDCGSCRAVGAKRNSNLTYTTPPKQTAVNVWDVGIALYRSEGFTVWMSVLNALFLIHKLIRNVQMLLCKVIYSSGPDIHMDWPSGVSWVMSQSAAIHNTANPPVDDKIFQEDMKYGIGSKFLGSYCCQSAPDHTVPGATKG